MRGTNQNGNGNIGLWGGNVANCGRRGAIRRLAGLVSALALGGIMTVQAATRPASSLPAAPQVVALATESDHGYRADIVDDIIDLINDLLNPPPPPPPPPAP